jgi:stage II sporulation protein AA (anti-sigma F factor antagonist)
MKVAVRFVDGVAVLDLDGRLILGDGEEAFRRQVDELLQQGCLKVLVNFNDVTYIDSAGVGAVVWKYVTLRRRGGMLKLLHLRQRTHRVLSVTRLLTVLENFEAEEEAVRSFSPA